MQTTYSFAHYQYYLYKYLQNQIDVFMNCCILWRVKLNANKTDAVYFPKKIIYPNQITINNVTIPWTNDTKYLGVMFDRRLIWNKHIVKVRVMSVAFPNLCVPSSVMIFCPSNINSVFTYHVFDLFLFMLVRYGHLIVKPWVLYRMHY